MFELSADDTHDVAGHEERSAAGGDAIVRDVTRSDNGPQYISQALKERAALQGIRLDYIQPGNPQQNACVERFKRTVRYEWLSVNLWENLEDVQACATEWMWTYNHERPTWPWAASPQSSVWPRLHDRSTSESGGKWGDYPFLS